jgi:hypothetical protein
MITISKPYVGQPFVISYDFIKSFKPLYQSWQSSSSSKSLCLANLKPQAQRYQQNKTKQTKKLCEISE